MLLIGLDFETTFTDPVQPKEARIIETGAVLWSTIEKGPILLQTLLLWAPEYVYDPRITDLTGLSESNLKGYGRDPKKMLEKLLKFMSLGTYVVAHNGNEFDKVVLESECQRHGLVPPPIPWLDTSVDVPYPEKIQTRKLDFLAPSHGFLNPFAHRALFDVCSMLKVLNHYDIQEVIRRANTPKVRLRAMTQKPWEDGGKSNQIAKDNGYRYNGEGKMWLKTVLADEVEAEQKKIPLPTMVLK